LPLTETGLAFAGSPHRNTRPIVIASGGAFCESRSQMKKLEDLLLSDEMMQAPSHEVER
jgi:hypothetical protein